MTLPRETIIFGNFGGQNVADPAEELIEKSHVFDRGRWLHRSGQFGRLPMQSPISRNIDFPQNELSQRKGSVTLADLTATGLNVFLSGDVLIQNGGYQYKSPVTNSRVQLHVSKKTIYTDQSGAWAQIKNASGIAYVHSDQTVTKCSFTEHDGHLDIGLDGNNATQVYRTGANLDNQLNNNLTSTTVDADSSSGQKVLNVAATASFLVNDFVIIDEGSSGGGEERGQILSIQAGVSITLQANLTFTHTLAQADVVAVNNLYTEAFGGATRVVTGAWNTGYFMVEGSHGHLAFCTGDTVVEFTAVNAAYDRANGGFYQTRSVVTGMKAFTPEFASELREVIFLFTEIGFEYFGGFEIYDLLEKIDAPAPMNHQVIVATEKWLMYLTAQGGIAATDGRSVIDVGRRFKAGDGVTGPLDVINLANSALAAFGFYDETAKRVLWGIATGVTAVVDRFVGLDMQLEEPIPGETQPSFESHVRPLNWTGLDYVSIWQAQGSIVGARSTGFLYTLETGLNDFDTVAIDAHWFSPIFNAGRPFNEKGWLVLFIQGLSKGNWPVFVNYYKNGSTGPTKQFNFEQGTDASVWDTAVWDTGTWSANEFVKGSDDINLVADSIQFEVFNQLVDETFTVTNMEVRHEILAEQR